MKDLKKLIPHIGMRKIKSILAVFVGFWVWQLIRLAVPQMEVHPIYIYLYGIIEMRDTSEKTVEMGKCRIKATVTALAIGLPLLLLNTYIKSLVANDVAKTAVELTIILLGALIVLCVAEKVGCKLLCGLSAAIFIILLVAHSDDEPILYSILRTVQTILGVSIAWLINVKIFPYPKKKKPSA